MSSPALTVRGLFGADRIGLDGESIDRLASSETFERIEALVHERARPTWAAVRRAVPERLGALLDIDVVDVLVAGWNKSRELRKYRDPSMYPPDDLILVPLTRHKIVSTHRPALEIVVEGETVGRLQFEIDLGFTFEGAELAIQNGRITRIRTGQCLGTGTIRCEGAVLGQAERKLLPLPGVIDLGEGILIPAERAAL